MNSEIMKGKPLSKVETTSLLDLIESSKIITSKTTNATNNKLKTEEWIRLTDRFNATVTTCPRTPQQLRLKWENLKKNSRKRSTKIRINLIQTGGGAAEYIPPDDILERVSSLLGSTVTGFAVPFGGDKDPIFSVDDNDGDGGGDGVTATPHYVAGSVMENGDGCINGDDCDLMGFTSTPNRNNDNHYGLISAPKTKFTFNMPRTVKKKKIVPDDSRGVRNLAIAEYYSAKKNCLDANLSSIMHQNENVKLQNDNLKLQNDNLKLQNDNLKLQNDKLKLECENYKC